MDGIGGEMLTMYFKTPPSSAVTHSSSVEVTSDQSNEGVTSPVPKAVHPHLKNQSQGSRQAHLLLQPLLRVGPNVLLNHHRD